MSMHEGQVYPTSREAFALELTCENFYYEATAKSHNSFWAETFEGTYILEILTGLNSWVV